MYYQFFVDKNLRGKGKYYASLTVLLFHFYTISEFIIHGHATMERTRSVSHSIARSDASRWFSSASMLSNTRLWNDFSLRSSHNRVPWD